MIFKRLLVGLFVGLLSVFLYFSFALTGISSISIQPQGDSANEKVSENPFIPVSYAASSCIAEYYYFVSGVRSEKTRANYFKDFFTLNTCQLNDILELYDELDALKEQFRGAASSCEDTSSYRRDFHRILMEIYFIRNIQKRDPGVTRESDAQKIEESKDLLLERLKEEMRAIFVLDEVRVSDETLNDYYSGWSEKYYDVIGEYARCEEGPWAEITDTWKNFIETIKDLSIDVPDTSESESFVDRFSASAPTGDELEEMFANPFRDVIGGKKVADEDAESAIREDLGPELTVEEAAEEARTFSSAIDLLTDSKREYEVQANAKNRMARYAILYGQGGAQTTSNLQGIIKNISTIIKEMNDTDLPGIRKAVKKISERQCSG